MNKRFTFLGICICSVFLLCSCKIKSDKMISQKVLDDRKAEYEQYLAEKYPGQTFTVEVWQEYGETIGAAGLPDYEGYLIRQVITDSEGNHFQVSILPKGEHSDDYQEVLDGKIHYNEKGQQIHYDENKEVWYVIDR